MNSTPALLELVLRGVEVGHVELERRRRRANSMPERVALHHREGQVVGVELISLHVSPLLAQRQAERLLVELLRRLDVGALQRE